MREGSLTIVGTGYMVAGQITPEAMAHIERADRLFYLGGDPATRMLLERVNPTSESLYDAYKVGGHRKLAYQEMTRRMLAPVREGADVCAAFYGHPGVFVDPSHNAIRMARAEGLRAAMLPAISAEDCLFADLMVDPAEHGCTSMEATSFLLRQPDFDPRSALILWQIGGIGVTTYEEQELWSRRGLEVLVDALLCWYPPEHPVVVYQASIFPMFDPSIERMALSDVARADVNTRSTMYVPPVEHAGPDPDVWRTLGHELAQGQPTTTSAISDRQPTGGGKKGVLTVVGTGYNVAGQVTPEARAHIESAEHVFYLLSDPATASYVKGLNPNTTSLHDSYWEGRNGREACDEMTDRILAEVRNGTKVCAAFYGHPGIFVGPSHDAISMARKEGHTARMLPGVSAPDCMFADIGFDPGKLGCQLFEATDFLVSHRQTDPSVPLVLLQVGAVGTREYHARREGDRETFAVLVDRLRALYPQDHEVVVYEKAQLPTHESRVEALPLSAVEEAELTVYTSLYVPPSRDPALLQSMAAQLGLEDQIVSDRV